MRICIRCIVSGRVQGVWYRQSTLEMAERLDVKGWVKNLTNGNVELLACGDEINVEKLQSWLWQGRPNSQVSDVVCETIAFEKHDGFSVIS